MKHKKIINKNIKKYVTFGVIITIFAFFLIFICLFTDVTGKPHYIITSFAGKMKAVKISDCRYGLITEIDNKFTYAYDSFGRLLSYKSLDNLKYADDLKEIRVTGRIWSSFDNVDFLNNDRIEILEVINLYSNDWSALGKLKNLKKIELSDVNVSDMSLFNGMDDLSYIFISSPCSLKFTGVSPNNSVEHLEIKSISGEINDISGISNFKKIRTLILYNTSVTDISELESLTALEYLQLEKNDKINNYDPLLNMTNLKELYIENDILSEEQITKLREKGTEVILH